MPQDIVPSTISQVSSILEGRTLAKEEQRVLDLLRGLETEDFCKTLAGLDLSRLVEALDDRMWGPDSRKEFLRISQPHLSQLDLPTKAAFIRALAPRTHQLASERTVVKLFLSEEGEKLTKLKLLVDCATDGWDLLRIAHDFVESADLRYDLFRHFQKAAPASSPCPLRIVSDIDDTLYSSLNDSRYPKGTIYPGVLELLSCLSELPPVFLTARPELIGSLFERITHQQLASYGIERCTVLSGNLPGLMGHRRMAEQKARTLTSYRELYPEHRFLFIGDSGQGDMALSQSLLRARPPILERALIHRLGDFQPGSESKHRRIHTFDNYLEAAVILQRQGYLNLEQLRSIEQAVT